MYKYCNHIECLVRTAISEMLRINSRRSIPMGKGTFDKEGHFDEKKFHELHAESTIMLKRWSSQRRTILDILEEQNEDIKTMIKDVYNVNDKWFDENIEKMVKIL